MMIHDHYDDRYDHDDHYHFHYDHDDDHYDDS